MIYRCNLWFDSQTSLKREKKRLEDNVMFSTAYTRFSNSYEIWKPCGHTNTLKNSILA